MTIIDDYIAIQEICRRIAMKVLSYCLSGVEDDEVAVTAHLLKYKNTIDVQHSPSCGRIRFNDVPDNDCPTIIDVFRNGDIELQWLHSNGYLHRDVTRGPAYVRLRYFDGKLKRQSWFFNDGEQIAAPFDYVKKAPHHNLWLKMLKK